MKKTILIAALLLSLTALAVPSGGQDASVPDCNEILDNAKSIIFTWDNQTRVTYINPFGLQYFGFSRDELVGKSFVGTFTPATSTSGQDLYGMVRDIARHPEAYAFNENQNVKKSGERVDILWSNSAVRDSKGNVVKIVSIGNVKKAS